MQVERGKTHTEISSINTDEGNGKINTRGRCQKPEIDALESLWTLRELKTRSEGSHRPKSLSLMLKSIKCSAGSGEGEGAGGG